jgi:hypothetical protein
MGFALRWLASGLVVSCIALALSSILPPHPVALHWLLFAGMTVLIHVALSWRHGSQARSLAIAIGVSLILMMAGLTLFIPNSWAPWF